MNVLLTSCFILTLLNGCCCSVPLDAAIDPPPGARAGRALDVCQGKPRFCVNETVVQQCEPSADDPTRFVQKGDPELCEDTEVCDPSEEAGCAPIPAFQCQVTGVFRDPPGCSRYHICLVYPNRVSDTLITCAKGLAFSSKYKACVSPNLSDCSGCSQ